MSVFLYALAGAFLGSIVGAILLAKLRKVEANLPPEAPLKKILRPVVGAEPTGDNPNKVVHDWLYGEQEEKK